MQRIVRSTSAIRILGNLQIQRDIGKIMLKTIIVISEHSPRENETLFALRMLFSIKGYRNWP